MQTAPTFGNHTTIRRHVRLSPTVYAPRIARRLVVDLGSAVRTPQRLIDDAALVTGEIVTSAIRYTRSEIDVMIEVSADHVRVRIRDQRTTKRSPGSDTGTGMVRRTALIERLATSWGRHRSASGWETWALLHADQPGQTAGPGSVAS